MIMKKKSIIWDALGWTFAVIDFGIGLVNVFWVTTLFSECL